MGATGNFGCVGGNVSDAMNVDGWNSRVEWGWKRKNTSTLTRASRSRASKTVFALTDAVEALGRVNWGAS